ncbi:hypothetical protein LSAT2_024083 [Lamellibrachia satsuma]|nr:hypothetical protein LSAT2_024083 [Lamellibrachia satsuma]
MIAALSTTCKVGVWHTMKELAAKVILVWMDTRNTNCAHEQCTFPEVGRRNDITAETVTARDVYFNTDI